MSVLCKEEILKCIEDGYYSFITKEKFQLPIFLKKTWVLQGM
jgi:hypothetical protein